MPAAPQADGGLVLLGDDVPAALPGDLLLVQLAAYRAPGSTAVAYGAAAGLWHVFGGEPGFVVVGDPADAAALLRTYAAGDATVTDASVPRGAVPLLADLGWREEEGWAFRWTRHEPLLPVADEVAWVPRDGEDEVREVLATAFPHASLPVGHPDVRRWAGLRRDGRLVAIAADATLDERVGFLASIATLPETRGTGAGTAVTAWATAALVREHGACGLWLMAGNAVAAALYTRLGYRDEHPMAVLVRD